MNIESHYSCTCIAHVLSLLKANSVTDECLLMPCTYVAFVAVLYSSSLTVLVEGITGLFVSLCFPLFSVYNMILLWRGKYLKYLSKQ